MHGILDYLYIKLLIFFKGFHISEFEIHPNGELIKTYRFDLNDGKTIDFHLYRIHYEGFTCRLNRCDFKKATNYALVAQFDPSLPESVTRFNHMSLKSFNVYLNEKREDLFLQIAVEEFINLIFVEIQK